MIVTVPVADLQGKDLTAVPVNEALTLVVFQVADSYHALEDECPHRGARLSDGNIEGNLVVCPLHHFKFDAGTGRCTRPRHLVARRYPVTQDGGLLYIDVGSVEPS